jgi:surface antigen
MMNRTPNHARGTTRRAKLLAFGVVLLGVQAAGTIAWADPRQDGVPQTVASVATAMPTPARVMPAPYGLDRGTCDRSTLVTEIAAGKPRRATVGGGVLGSLIGAELGRAMDEADQVCVAQALEYAPDRAHVAWAAHDGEELTIAPETTFEREGGWCRTYRATAVFDGRRTTTLGTACRGPDGLWRANG